MRNAAAAISAAALLVLLGCVMSTKHQIEAHIVVEIRQKIENQAEDILDFIEEGEKAPENGSFLHRVLDGLTPIRTAHAAELTVQDSPRIRELQVEMRERNTEVQELKEKGYTGEDNRGYLVVREGAAFPDSETKNAVQKVVAAENANRKDLYKELARLNQDDGATLSLVEKVFAKSRLDRAKSGEYFQLPEGAEFEKFKQTKLAKQLGDKAKPSAWVQIPE